MTPTKRNTSIVAMAIAIATGAEGLRQYAYRDPVGILTVCYGHTGDVERRRYSLEECEMLLTSDMHKAVDIVAECVPGLPEKVHAAFADAVFNMGPTIACSKKKSTAARMLAEGDYVGACNQLARWTKAHIMGSMVELPGLVKRRARERELCLQGVV